MHAQHLVESRDPASNVRWPQCPSKVRQEHRLPKHRPIKHLGAIGVRVCSRRHKAADGPMTMVEGAFVVALVTPGTEQDVREIMQQLRVQQRQVHQRLERIHNQVPAES